MPRMPEAGRRSAGGNPKPGVVGGPRLEFTAHISNFRCPGRTEPGAGKDCWPSSWKLAGSLPDAAVLGRWVGNSGCGPADGCAFDSESSEKQICGKRNRPGEPRARG